MTYGDKFEMLVGKTLTDVEQQGDDLIVFTAEDGAMKMYHSQDCCESVVIESVTGDFDDLIGTPILVAEERVSDNPPEPPEGSQRGDESNTWTFYTLRTIKGTVDIRWHGSSNGYYSESVYVSWELAAISRAEGSE